MKLEFNWNNIGVQMRLKIQVFRIPITHCQLNLKINRQVNRKSADTHGRLMLISICSNEETKSISDKELYYDQSTVKDAVNNFIFEKDLQLHIT